ncbi:glutamate receptor ionotropic, kainate 3-like isoform X2 [Lineus longissimus]
MIGPYLNSLDFLFASKVPYFLITNGPVDYANKNGIGATVECERSGAGKAISVLPALDYIAYPILYYIGKYREMAKVNVVVITEDAESMSLLMNSDSVYMDSRPRLFPLVLPEALSMQQKKRRLGYTRTYGITEYLVHSNRLEFIKGLFALARSLNLMVPVYTWYLTYPDIVSLTLDPEATSIMNNRSRVVGVDYIGAFSDYSLKTPTAGKEVAHATLFDSLLVLTKAISSLLSVGGAVKASAVDTILRRPIISPLTGLTGSLAGTNNDPTMHNSSTLLCRREVAVNVYAFQNGSFGKVSSYALPNNSFVKTGWPLPNFSMHMYPNRDANSVLFNRIPARVAVRVDKPLVMVNTSATNNAERYYGVLIDYLKEYARRMNFTYELYETPDGKIGELSPSTGWTGLVRQLIDENATLALGTFQQSEIRSKFIDATSLVQLGYLSLLMKRPSLQTSPWQFVQPFSWSLWLTVAGIYIVVSFMLYLVTYLDKQQPKFNLLESFYYLAGLLFGGATDAYPTSTPSRIITGVFIFFSIVVFQSYTANMTAFLTMRRTGDIVADLVALSKQSTYEYGVVNGSEAHNILSSSTEETQKRIWMYIDRKKTNRILQSYGEAIDKIGAGKFILLSETVLTRYYQSKNCSLMSVDQQSTMPIRYAIGLRKGSPLVTTFNTIIEKVNEEDFGEKMQKSWYPNPNCAQDFQASTAKIKTSPLSWSEMIGIFITLAIGACVAILLALVGWCHNRTKTGKEKRVNAQERNNESTKF